MDLAFATTSSQAASFLDQFNDFRRFTETPASTNDITHNHQTSLLLDHQLQRANPQLGLANNNGTPMYHHCEDSQLQSGTKRRHPSWQVQRQDGDSHQTLQQQQQAKRFCSVTQWNQHQRLMTDLVQQQHNRKKRQRQKDTPEPMDKTVEIKKSRIFEQRSATRMMTTSRNYGDNEMSDNNEWNFIGIG